MRAPSLRIVQQLLRLAGEAAWLFAWSAVLGHWIDPASGAVLPIWLLCAVLAVAAVLSRAATRRTNATWLPVAVSSLGVATSVGAGLFAASLATGPLDFARLGSSTAGTWASVAGCLAVVAWWRGSRLGANRPIVYEVEGQFRFGILAVAGLLALIALLGAGASPEPAALVEPALILVASGLVGVPLARIAEVSAERRADSPRLYPSGPWLGTLLGVVGGLLLLTLLLGGIVTADRLGVVLGLILGAMGRVLGVIVTILAMPVGYLLEWIVNLLKARMTGQPPEPTMAQLPSLEDLAKNSQHAGAMPTWLELLLDVAIVAGIVFVIVVMLSRALVRRRYWQREPDGVEELRESVFGWETIRELIAWLFGRLRRPVAAVAGPSAESEPVEPRSVREVYREFLRLTARLGFPRTRAETPLEYARRIERDRLSGQDGVQAEVPDVRGELDTLTSTYVRVRYGPPDSSQSDVGPVTRALERLRALWTKG